MKKHFLNPTIKLKKVEFLIYLISTKPEQEWTPNCSSASPQSHEVSEVWRVVGMGPLIMKSLFSVGKHYLQQEFTPWRVWKWTTWRSRKVSAWLWKELAGERLLMVLLLLDVVDKILISNQVATYIALLTTRSINHILSERCNANVWRSMKCKVTPDVLRKINKRSGKFLFCSN